MGTSGLTISEFIEQLGNSPSDKKAEIYSFLITFSTTGAHNLPLGYMLLKKSPKLVPY